MRIAIAQSLSGASEVLRRVIISHPGYEILWTAKDGLEAVEKSAMDTPDLMLIDISLPGMDGAEATRLIMMERPCAILIVTSFGSGKAAQVFEALGNGALDVIDMPLVDEKGRVKGGNKLLKKIAAIEKLIRKKSRQGKRVSTLYSADSSYPMIAIGSSTGGPKALADILSSLPQRISATIVIVQHLDVQFAEGLAEWLNEQTKLKVSLAKTGIHPDQDMVFVAGTNDHLILDGDCSFNYVPEPRDYPYRPSVDRFFFSARDFWPVKGIAVLLTGMGRDGARGLLALRNAGWHTIAQNEKTSAVYGMPKAAAELGAADEILPMEGIVEAILQRLHL
ncbi:MAG: chemotaxis response regulator protein-glutamate methylesterase [Syntrophus sp. (in: bacteria)]|nr:chemotaxis response regulator protein-glutamate methylesterase [Syntrophus sp. (in: bacteria)]